jgi:polyadenylation factor subunit 2
MDKIPYCLEWAPNGKRVMVGNSKGGISRIDALNFAQEMGSDSSEKGVKAIVISKDEKFYITGDEEGMIKKYNITLKQDKSFKSNENGYSVRELSIAPTNMKFVSALEDKTLKIWDVNNEVPDRLLEGHGNEVICCDWHPQKGLIVSGSKDTTVKFWDPNTGNELATINAHNNSLKKVKWNANGNWLLTCSKDQSMKLYDIRMFKEIQAFIGLKSEIEALAWHPLHEKLLATGDKLGTIAYWMIFEKDAVVQLNHAHYVHKKDKDGDMNSKPLQAGAKINDLIWSPIGNMLASCGQDKNVKIWGRINIEDRPQTMM